MYENIEEVINSKVRRINDIINFLRYLLRAQQEGMPIKEVKSDLFDAEIRLYPVGKNLVKAVIRVEPKIDIPQELLSLIYLSELATQDEEVLFKIAVEQSYKKMLVGGVLHLSAVLNKELIKTEIKRILTKIKRAFLALTNDEIRARIINEKRKLDELVNSPQKNKREILITLMRLNEILLYEAPVRKD